MEDEKGATGSSARASSSATPAADAPPTPPSKLPKESPALSQRQRYTVELRPGETTIVSWKKLLKASNKRSGSSAADLGRSDAVLECGVGPGAAVQPVESEPHDAVPPPSRFSAVIEKIERLYVGNQSSDEAELDDIPDDDQYGTEDSFIDDAELDEYFQVDKLETKHDGYFVNRGKLEPIEPSSSPNLAPKKRRRRDSTNIHSENDLYNPTEPVNMGNMRIKAAARSAPLAGKKLPCPTKTVAPFGEHYQDIKRLKSKLNSPTGTFKKNSADFAINLENRPSVKISKDVSSQLLEPKDLDTHKTGVTPSRDLAHKSRGTSESFDGMYQASRDKGVSSQFESQSKKLLNDVNGIEVPTKIRRRERNGVVEFPDLKSSGNANSMQTEQPSSMGVKERFVVRPKGSMFERAIRDLEKIVAESRPSNLDLQEVDTSSQGIKRRLPQEVKQKLAKVARLLASQDKISEDALIDRLMGILGHLVQRKTLQRNMKELVALGLSAKQQKADRFHQIRKEVHEMIRAHVSLMKSKVTERKDGSADDFLKGKYSMDKALEDKICDLYDLYVEGMAEDKGPQSRKLYVQLAELWPNGYMDNLGIKDAIYRSKERKRSMYRRNKVRDEERIKRRRLTSAIRVDDHGAQLRTGQERASIASTDQVLAFSDNLISHQPLASSGRLSDPAPAASMVLEDGSRTDAKKKMKRKPESDIGHFHDLAHQVKERPKSHRHGDEANVADHPNPSLSQPCLLGSNQPS